MNVRHFVFWKLWRIAINPYGFILSTPIFRVQLLTFAMNLSIGQFETGWKIELLPLSWQFVVPEGVIPWRYGWSLATKFDCQCGSRESR